MNERDIRRLTCLKNYKKKANLRGNNFTSKAGEYIGEALSSNPDYPLGKLKFGGVCLEDAGLVRIIEAVNINKNIVQLSIG